MKLVSRSLALFGVVGLASPPAEAQNAIATDGSLGGAAVDVGVGIDPTGQTVDYLISDDLGSLRGDNLFHSFARFGIGTGEIASFTGPDHVKNVISRVTGGDPSNIDGTLRSTMPDADIWLLNPRGIVFGEGARLEVPGSFHAATADYLGFEEGGDRFDARLQLSSVLSTARPSAFGFLPETIVAAPIDVTGSALSVLPGKTLELAGGDIALTGTTLGAPAGTIAIRGGQIVIDHSQVLAENIDSATPGRLEIDANDSLRFDSSRVSVSSSAAGSAGAIEIVSGGPIELVNRGLLLADSRLGDAGTIAVEAGSLELRNGTISAGGGGSGDGGVIAIDTGALSIDVGSVSARSGRSGDAGTITVDADSVRLHNASISAISGGEGRGGSIAIDAGSVRVENGAIGVESGGTGDAGAISIGALGEIELVNSASIGARASVGDAGTIAIDAGSLRVDGGTISADSGTQGGAGAIAIRTEGTVTVRDGSISTANNGPGPRGSITIDAGALELRDGGQIVARSNFGAGGDGGDVLIRADTVQIGPGREDGEEGAGIFVTAIGSGNAGNVLIDASQSIRITDENGPRFDWTPLLRDEPVLLTGIGSGTRGGFGGSIELYAPEITVEEGAWVTSATVRGSDGGSILLRGDRIRIASGGVVSGVTMFTPAQGGAVTLDARESIEVVGHSRFGDVSAVSSNTTNEGPAGHVTLSAPRILIDGGSVNSGAAALIEGGRGGAAGEVTLIAPSAGGQVIVRGAGAVSASTLGSGHGGSVDIEAGERIRVEGEHSVITSRTGADGAGGDVTLRAPHIEIADGGAVSAESAQGFGELDVWVDFFRGYLAEPPEVPTGDAGRVTLVSDTLRVVGGAIATSAVSADGGDITVQAKNRVHLDDGSITASVTGGTGGNIAIDPEVVILQNGSRITAQAGEGSGGHIRIAADHFFAFPGSIVSASSGNPELSGTVEIASPDADLAGSLTPLPSSVLDAASQMQQRCATRGGERAGTFAMRGAGGIPAEPDGWLPAPVVAAAAPIAGVPGPMLASAGCP